MILQQDQVLDEYARPVPGAKIYVTTSTGTDALLTSDGSSPVEQPLTTDEFGIYAYYVDAGTYREDIWYGGKRRFRQVITIGTVGAVSLTDGDYGDIVVSGTGASMTVDAGAITLAKMAALPAQTILGNTSGASSTPLALTAAQAAALLPSFSGDTGAGGVKGSVPAPAAGDAAAGRFLKADGSWATPAGGGGGGAGTTANPLTFNASNAGAASGSTFDGSSPRTISANSVGALPLGGGTLTGRLLIAASASAGAGINVPHGTAPTAPVNGDLWSTTAGAFWQINGAIKTVVFNDGSISGQAGSVANALTFSNGGGGSASGSTFDGSSARTISYNSIGAAPLASPAFTGTPTAPTAALNTATTQIASTAFVDRLRDVPSVNGGLTRAAVFTTAAGFTVNTANAGEMYMAYNDSASPIALTQGASLTLRLHGTALTGDRSLAARGMCSIWYKASGEAVISGDVS